jgi:DNA helicase-2/ATP-dependent DNA helicase PcrA
MPITQQQIQVAQQHQFRAAQDSNSKVRLIAGPGTGKSRCIEERVNHLLSQGVNQNEIFVISFTRATARDLKQRIIRYCSQFGRALAAQGVNVSTMHALALRTLRNANLLQGFPADPCILDDWEQREIFDAEFTSRVNMTAARAEKIRLAFDAQWQTLQSLQLYAQPPISATEQQAFTSFHASIKRIYSCFLPGEVVRACVDQMRMGNIDPAQLPGIVHLIVDEYQDLNECDQEFVQRIANAGATLWVAGDDDQSIYAFRYAAPIGIRNFATNFPGSSSHVLQYCFRCAPSILDAALSLMSASPNRLHKNLQSLYISSQPPVQGSFQVWRFAQGIEEARAIATSCQSLIATGLPPREILILLCNTRAQLSLLLQELQTAGVPFERPRGGWMLDSEVTRLVFSLLRIIKDPRDYMAHRTVLGLQHGVGANTCGGIAEKTLQANLNFHDLFYAPYPSNVFSSREDRAIQRTSAIVQQISGWNLSDTLQVRAPDITSLISSSFNAAGTHSGQLCLQEWQTLVSMLPPAMNLEELWGYLWSDTEAGQSAVLEAVATRLGLGMSQTTTQQDPTQRIRILTMHGAKGLDGSIVFIPGLEEGIIPSRQALQAAGLYEEQRRLLYCSITRSRAACILSLVTRRTGQQAFTLASSASVRLPPSPFLNDIGITPQPRTNSLTPTEVASIMLDYVSL